MAIVASKLDQQLAALAAQQQQVDDTTGQLTDLVASTEAQTKRAISDTIAIELAAGARCTVARALGDRVSLGACVSAFDSEECLF